jgi:hypothetical protein
MKNLAEQEKEGYIQWLKDTGRMKYELTDIFINDNGEIKTEKKMAWVMKNTPGDWKKFCEETGKEYEGSVNLLAIY